MEITWQGKEKMILDLLARDGDVCFICKKDFGKKEKKTIDHWIPISKGGTWDLPNLRLAHRECNFWKGDRVPLEDGTIPDKPPKKSSVKNNKKKDRPVVCSTCISGRKLMHGQQCSSCNSGPKPIKYPSWAKRKTVECDHQTYHCFACILGFVKRSA